MPGTEVKNFDSPDEVRPFEGNGKADVLMIGGHTVGRGTFEPGWRWSNNVKPIAGTDSCQVSHLAYVVSGRMGIRMDDGTEAEVGPGDVLCLPAGSRCVGCRRRGLCGPSTSASSASTPSGTDRAQRARGRPSRSSAS
jgi:hypothetical protein